MFIQNFRDMINILFLNKNRNPFINYYKSLSKIFSALYTFTVNLEFGCLFKKYFLNYICLYSIVAKIHIEKNKYQIITDIIIYSLYVISFGTYLLKILGIV